jgi:magnesium transporter
MLSFYRKNDQQESFTQIQSEEEGCWIHIEDATSEDLQYICLLTNLQEADISDALDPHELPRIEEGLHYIILFTRHPIEQKGHLHTVPLTILLTTPYFITISPVKSTLIEKILHKNNLSSISTPSEFLIEVLHSISHEFNIQTKKARHNVMAQRKEIHSVDSNDISTLTEGEEVLNQYIASLGPLEETIEELSLIKLQSFHEATHSEIDDIFNSLKQSLNICNTLIQNIRSLRDSYQIIFANKLTRTIKLLTALTIIFSIPNMIASVYGMNVHLPLAESGNAFIFLIVFMSGLSGLCGYWFYRKKWM